MFILKLAGKILLLPVWLILFVIGLAVKMTVQTYAVVRGILGFIFTLLIIATAYLVRKTDGCYDRIKKTI